LTVVVPSTPADAGGLFTAALRHEGPVIFMEPKLLSEMWLSFLGSGGRTTVRYDVPEAGARGPVPARWEPVPIGAAARRRPGRDVCLVGVGVGVHRALEAEAILERDGISAGVLDLRTVSPLDRAFLREAAAETGRVVVVDEDYEAFGLSGELAAVLLEAGPRVRYGRVCVRSTIPYARRLEDEALPNARRICVAVRALMKNAGA
jgi:pyruvate/2-oxoglutarate/acetoin dehydrogenase E1 component